MHLSLRVSFVLEPNTCMIMNCLGGGNLYVCQILIVIIRQGSMVGQLEMENYDCYHQRGISGWSAWDVSRLGFGDSLDTYVKVRFSIRCTLTGVVCGISLVNMAVGKNDIGKGAAIMILLLWWLWWHCTTGGKFKVMVYSFCCWHTGCIVHYSSQFDLWVFLE